MRVANSIKRLSNQSLRNHHNFLGELIQHVSNPLIVNFASPKSFQSQNSNCTERISYIMDYFTIVLIFITIIAYFVISFIFAMIAKLCRNYINKPKHVEHLQVENKPIIFYIAYPEEPMIEDMQPQTFRYGSGRNSCIIQITDVEL